jgi:acyl dehydratase
MPLDSRLVGERSEGVTHDIDARWTMAYAAGLGDALGDYFDTDANESVMAHPLFPVCLEWQVRMAPEAHDIVPLSRDEAARGVHATHDLHIHRPIRSGDRLTTVATTVGIEQRKPGAYRVQRFDTHDADDRAVCTTYNGALMIDVPVAGEDRWTEALPAIPEVPASDARPRCFEIAVGHGLAHVYTECARIWNPIHTDRAVALRAALPDIILHGTATLGLALSKLIDGILEGAPARVRRVCCRFGAMVLMPSTLTLEITGATESEIAFRVLTADGSAAISAGYVAFV